MASSTNRLLPSNDSLFNKCPLFHKPFIQQGPLFNKVNGPWTMVPSPWTMVHGPWPWFRIINFRDIVGRRFVQPRLGKKETDHWLLTKISLQKISFEHLMGLLCVDLRMAWAAYRAVTQVFCKITSRKIKNQFKNPKISNFSKTSKRFQMHPNASERIPAGPNGSEWVRTRLKASKTLRKRRTIWWERQKTFRNFWQTNFNFFQKLFWWFILSKAS